MHEIIAKNLNVFTTLIFVLSTVCDICKCVTHKMDVVLTREITGDNSSKFSPIKFNYCTVENPSSISFTISPSFLLVIVSLLAIIN